MITLYTFGPAFGLPDASPFVIKAELLLKLAGLPYQTRRGNVRRAPKGKLPYLDDMGRLIADSTLIRWHIEKTYHIDFDEGLTPAQRGTAWAVEKLLEDISFNAAKQSGQTVSIDRAYVDARLKDLAQSEDLARYVL